jgi:hypothetical protein
MVKQLFRMNAFLNRQRFGEPQFIAGVLLLVFLAQCAWLVASDLRSGEVRDAERFIILRGLDLWHGKQTQHTAPITFFSDGELSHPQVLGPQILTAIPDPNHSALYYLVAGAPLLAWPGSLENNSVIHWGWLARSSGLFFGVCLGASVWYVARRLYGNAGGYVALVLYCFSPGVIRASAGWFTQPEMGAAWGAFGAIFTGIAVAHTLYAPREVVLWNWRRIVLLGIALAISIGSQFSLVILLPLVLAFMLYLAPQRRGAALVIWAAACLIELIVILASYFFRLRLFWQGIRHAHFFPITGSAFRMPGAYLHFAERITQDCPALMVALPAALVVFACWRRARYFGNAAPLLVSGIFILMGLGMPHYPGMGFRLLALPFLFLFIAGIAADLFETRQRAWVLPATAGLLLSYALWSMMELGQVKG